MYTNAVDAIQNIPFLGGKISLLKFVVAKENAATIVEVEFRENKITLSIDTQERGIEGVLEKVMGLLGFKESPDLFWTRGPEHCFCWVTNIEKKDEIIEKMKSEMTAAKFIWQR